MNRSRTLATTALTALLSATTQPAAAGGLYIYEVSPADDIRPRAVWLNPAGMTSFTKPTAQASLAVIAPTMEFDPDVATAGGGDCGNAGTVAAIPDFAYVHPLGNDWTAGFTMLALYGGGVDYGNNFVGRYAVTEVTLGGLGLVPSLAYKVDDRFSVGGGVGIIYSTLDQKIAINNPLAADGQVHLDELDDWGYQPFIGLNYKVSDRLLLGLVYRAEMEVEFEGDAKVTNFLPNLPGPVIPSNFKRDAKVTWDNAQTVELGLRYRIDDDSLLALAASWEDWSVFDDNVISVDLATPNDPVVALERNWKDTWSLGATYVRFRGRDFYSAGFNYVSSPVDDDDRTFDLPFDETYKFSLGYFWRPAEHLTYGLGAALILGGDAEIDQTIQGVRAAGEFDSNHFLAVNATLRYQFQ
jgi:long-chain fatty acid transport protein